MKNANRTRKNRDKITTPTDYEQTQVEQKNGFIKKISCPPENIISTCTCNLNEVAYETRQFCDETTEPKTFEQTQAELEL